MRTWGQSEITSYCFSGFFGVNQVHCIGLKSRVGGEYLTCIVSTKIMEFWERLKCHQGDTSWAWYYLCNVAGLLHVPNMLGLMVSAARSNRRSPSLIPWRAKHQSVNFHEIVKFLTNDGRGGRPDWAILSAIYASAKTRKRKGSISSHCLYGQLL